MGRQIRFLSQKPFHRRCLLPHNRVLVQRAVTLTGCRFPPRGRFLLADHAKARRPTQFTFAIPLNETRRIAVNISRLPEMLRKPSRCGLALNVSPTTRRTLFLVHQDRSIRSTTAKYRSPVIMGGGRKATIVGFPLVWHAGGISAVTSPAVIA
jgi:hypothetical protein